MEGRKQKGRVRGPGDGSVYQRADGFYVAAFQTGYTEDGIRQRKVFVGKSRTEVVRKMDAARAQLVKGLPLPADQLTVGAYMERWLDESAANRLKQSTLMQYQRAVRKHLPDVLARKRLLKLTASDLDAAYARLRRDGTSAGVVLYLHKVIHAALADAVGKEIVARNVASHASPPKQPRPLAVAFTISQAKAFLDAVRGHPLEPLLLLTLGGGFRRGEVLALRWEDIDLDTGAVAIRQALSKAREGWEIGEPKTPGSRRVVHVPGFAVESLLRHRGDGAPTGLVFARSRSRHLEPREVLREFKAICARAGIGDGFTIRSLRHSQATLLLAGGTHPKVVQERLGHSRIGVTLDTYSHVLETLDGKAATDLDAMLVTR